MRAATCRIAAAAAGRDRQRERGRWRVKEMEEAEQQKSPAKLIINFVIKAMRITECKPQQMVL